MLYLHKVHDDDYVLSDSIQSGSLALLIAMIYFWGSISNSPFPLCDNIQQSHHGIDPKLRAFK